MRDITLLRFDRFNGRRKLEGKVAFRAGFAGEDVEQGSVVYAEVGNQRGRLIFHIGQYGRTVELDGKDDGHVGARLQDGGVGWIAVAVVKAPLALTLAEDVA